MQFEGAAATGTAELSKEELAHRYLWGPNTDQLLADEAIESLTDASQNETLWALTDHLGSVRDLVDSSGQVRKHTSYNGFGQVTGEQHYDSNGTAINASHAAAVDQLFGYTGKALDEATGLQNNLHRWCDAKIGKWVSQDPIGFNGGDANLSRYVGNQSTSYVDSDGLREQSFLEWLFGINKQPPRRGGAMSGGKGGGRGQSEISKSVVGERTTTTSFMEKHGDGKKSKECQKILIRDLTKGGEAAIRIAIDSSPHLQTIQWLNCHELAHPDREYSASDYLAWNGKEMVWIGGPAIVGGAVYQYGQKFGGVGVVTSKLSREASDAFRSGARDIWQTTTGRRAIWDNLQVHHRIPLEWSHICGKANPNRLANLVGINSKAHSQVTNAWNVWKQGLNGRRPTQAEVLEQALKIDELFKESWVFPK